MYELVRGFFVGHVSFQLVYQYVCINFVSMRMREFNPDGSLKDVTVLLHQAGYQLGNRVERKADKFCGTISSFIGDVVKVSFDSAPDVLACVPMSEFLMKQWSVIRVEPKEILEVSPSKNPVDFVEFQVSRVAAFTQLEVCNLTLSHRKHLDSVKVSLRPKRDVVCTINLDRGKLTLIPGAVKIQLRSIEAIIPASAMVVEVTPTLPFVFSLVPPLVDPEGRAHLGPFWYIGFITEADEVNMEMVHVKSQNDFCKLRIPVAKSCKPLKEGDRLTLMKLDNKKQAAAAVVENEPPKKKAKKQ